MDASYRARRLWVTTVTPVLWVRWGRIIGVVEPESRKMEELSSTREAAKAPICFFSSRLRRSRSDMERGMACVLEETPP